MLTAEEKQSFDEVGHVTVAPIVEHLKLTHLLECVEAWMDDVASSLNDSQANWFFEKQTHGGRRWLRKLEQPVFHQLPFRELATSDGLVSKVEQLIGKGVTAFYSQVFCKPPGVGGAKPAHQDNYYFGPEKHDDTLTVWFALDAATEENGCLAFVDGSHREPIEPHSAPEGEPFNLQISPASVEKRRWTLAPVPAGGVSFHHGNVWHRSEANTSEKPRRAVAIHYLRNDAKLVNPALTYDTAFAVRASE